MTRNTIRNSVLVLFTLYLINIGVDVWRRPFQTTNQKSR